MFLGIIVAVEEVVRVSTCFPKLSKTVKKISVFQHVFRNYCRCWRRCTCFNIFHRKCRSRWNRCAWFNVFFEIIVDLEEDACVSTWLPKLSQTLIKMLVFQHVLRNYRISWRRWTSFSNIPEIVEDVEEDQKIIGLHLPANQFLISNSSKHGYVYCACCVIL